MAIVKITKNVVDMRFQEVLFAEIEMQDRAPGSPCPFCGGIAVAMYRDRGTIRYECGTRAITAGPRMQKHPYNDLPGFVQIGRAHV